MNWSIFPVCRSFHEAAILFPSHFGIVSSIPSPLSPCDWWGASDCADSHDCLYDSCENPNYKWSESLSIWMWPVLATLTKAFLPEVPSSLTWDYCIAAGLCSWSFSLFFWQLFIIYNLLEWWNLSASSISKNNNQYALLLWKSKCPSTFSLMNKFDSESKEHPQIENDNSETYCFQ